MTKKNRNLLIGGGLAVAVLLVFLFWDKIKDQALPKFKQIVNPNATPVLKKGKDSVASDIPSRTEMLSDKLGVKSAAVMELQTKLNEIFSGQPLVVDGLFGPKTKARLGLAFAKETYRAEYSTTLQHFDERVYNSWKGR